MVMRAEVERAALRTAVNRASAPVKRSHIAICDCLLVKAEDGRLCVTGTNMDATAVASCEASVSDAGAAAVNARDIRAAIDAAPDGSTVSLTLDADNVLRIVAGRVKVGLPSLDPATFPLASKPDTETEVIHDGAFAFVEPFAHRGEPFNWAGINIERDVMVASDGKRLAWRNIEAGPADPVMIPSDASPLILKAMDMGGRLFVSERIWRVEAEGYQLIGKTLDAAFHSAWRRIAGWGGVIATVDADDLRRAIPAATLGRAEWLHFVISDDTIEIRGDKFDGGAPAESGTSIACEGHAAEFVLPAKHIETAMSAFSGCVVDVASDGIGFVFLRAHGNDERGITVGLLRDARTSLPQAQEAAA